MLREQLCNIEQRLVFGSGDDTVTLQLQNCRRVHLVSSSPQQSMIACDIRLAPYALVDNVTAYLFGAEFVSAGLARVVHPYPAIFI
jgi:hypothetical protein